MKQRLNVFIMLVFLVGQLILLPLQSMTAYAQVPALNDENVLTVSEEQPTTEEQASTDTTSGEGEQASTTESVIVEQPEEQTTEAEAENNKPADADDQTTSGLSPPVEGSTTEDSTKQEGENKDPSTENGEPSSEASENEDEEDENRDAQEEATTSENGKKGFHLNLTKATQGSNDEPFSEENPLNPMNEFFVHYNWSLDDGHGYKAGDTVSFHLPKQLNILAAANGELADEFGTVFANYHVATDGTVTFTFTEAVTEMSDIKGDFFIKSKLNPSHTAIEDGKVTIGPMEDGGSITIPVSTGEMAANISKAGTPLPAFSPKEIEWTITVDSKMLKHKDGKVTDMLPPGLTYKPGSMTINGDQVADPTIDGQNLEIALGDFSGTKTITLITTIDDKHWDDKLFHNKATYEATGVDKIKAEKSVEIDRGKPLTKKGGEYDPIEQEMEWEIELNFNGRTVTDTTIQDSWTEGLMELVDGSFEFYEVSIDDNGNATIVSKADVAHTINNSSTNGFDVVVPNIDKPYIVKYKTKLTDRLIEGQNISNGVKWNGNTSEGTVWAEQGVGYKGHSNVNYKDKTVDWYLVANTDHKEMAKFTINDTFGSGLTLKEDTFVVTVGGKTLTKGTDYTFAANDNGFTIQFIDAYKTLNEAVEVKYTTDFDYTKLKPGENFTNHAKYTWYTEGKDTPWEKEVSDTFVPDKYTKHDGNKSGYYDARDKTITWTIAVNYQQNAYEKLIVKDLIQGNQKLLPDTIKVSKGVLGGGSDSISAGAEIADANVTKPEVDGNPGFIVNLGKTDKPYVITYKTSLEGLDYIETNYANTANVLDGTTPLTDLPADVGITQGGKYGGKTGKQNGKAIDWTVTVNASQAKVQDVVLTDTLSANQEFLQDTIKVYATTVDNSGNVTKGAAYDNMTINVTEEAPQTLTVKFNETIDRPYIVEYSTLYFAGHNEIVSNDYKVTGSNIGNKGQQGGTASVTIDQSTGGSGSGKVGYLQVNKIASDDANKVFEGIEFQLIDEKTGKVLKTGVTDKDGNIDFGRLLYGKYLLKETKAPEGYITPTEAYKVTINKEYVKGDTEKIGNVETIVNDKEIKQIEIVKKSAADESKWLAGAEFMIKNAQGEVVEENLVTDANGKVTSKELPVGTYTLVETKAPTGYQKNETPVEFTIESGKTEPVLKEVTNVPYGAVTLQKVGKDYKNNSTELINLEGVKFDLQKKVDGSNFENVGSTLTTDENGMIVVDDLTDGTYRFVEVETLEGYKVDDKHKEWTFEIKDGKLTENPLTKIANFFKSTNAPTFYIENKVDDQTTKLVKHDEKDETKLLKGAQFKVYKKADSAAKPDPKTDEVVNDGQVYTTDENGEIIINDLPYGHYYYVETKAPSGYRIDRTPVEFEVKADAYVITKIGNKKSAVIVPPTTPEQCEDFTVVVKENGKPVKKDTEYTFTSEDGKTTVTEKTDKDGKLVIDRKDLPKGKYTVTDKDGNKVGEIEVEYDECKTELDIKTDKPGGGGGEDPKDPEEPTTPTDPETPEQCEDFTVVVKEDGKPVKKDTEYTFTSEDGKTTVTEKTDKDGKLVIDREDLPEGKYTVTDKDGNPVGEIEVEYDECETELDIAKPKQCEDFTVVVKENGKPVKKDTEYTFTSEDGKTTVTEKTDKDGKLVIDREKLPEGKYTVTDKDGNPVGEIEVEYDECETELDIAKPKQCEDFTVVVKENGKPVKKDTEYTFTSEDGKTTVTEKTDKDGKLVIDREKLPEGKYTVTDKDGNPVGEIEVEYEECETELDIKTDKPGGGGGGEDPKDPEEPTTPTDPESPEQCEDFTVVVKEDGKPVEKDTEYTFESEDGETIVTATTDENGKIVIDREKLPEGKYTVTDKDGNPVGEIEVEYEECETELDIKTEGSTGTGKTKVTLTKVDHKDESRTLEGAEFELYKKVENGPDELIMNGSTKRFITDDNGKIVVTDLAEGDYYFVEKRAPKGYQLNRKAQDFTVVENEDSTLVVTNKKRPSGGGGGGGGSTDPETPGTDPTDPEETPGGGGTEEPTDPETPGEGGTEEPTDPETPGEGGTEEPTDPETPGEGGTEEPTDPETPGEGGTEEPTDPETPGEGGTGKPTKPGNNGTVGKPTPSSPATPGKPVEKEGNETDSKGSKLPQTGEEQFIALIGFGALFVAFGGWLFLRSRRKEEQK